MKTIKCDKCGTILDKSGIPSFVIPEINLRTANCPEGYELFFEVVFPLSQDQKRFDLPDLCEDCMFDIVKERFLTAEKKG